MSIPVYLLSFFSGVAALSFEIVWFHLAGLALGNSVWTVSIVFAAFMAGMALGNWLLTVREYRVVFPLRLYAFLAFLIALVGLGLVIAFPYLSAVLASFFHLLSVHPLLINLVRILIAFFLMAVPSAAMGATLPVLVKSLCRRECSYGRLLGLLYGWNTAGAVAGVLMTEFFSLDVFGILGTGCCAALCSAFSSLGAWILSRKEKGIQAGNPVLNPAVKAAFSPRALRLLAAAFLCGFILLALEVVWFRFLILFFNALSEHFAIMLAMVLAGLSCGSLWASRYCTAPGKTYRYLFLFTSVNGILVTVLYGCFPYLLANSFLVRLPEWGAIFIFSLFLIFPLSCGSGVLFTLLGEALYGVVNNEVVATGLLTMANTLGSMCGSLAAGLVVLPRWGLEKAFFLTVFLYAATALLLTDMRGMVQSRRGLWSFILAVTVLAAALIRFPFGLMEKRFLPVPAVSFLREGARRTAFKEGLNETIQYLQTDLLGKPYHHYLITNNYSMSATTDTARRYMNFFAYWPLAVHPSVKDVLLISYGCGNTAKALTDNAAIRHIDIVDVSKDIVDMSAVVFPHKEDNPVYDSRVSVHIEDGRFFLLTTRRTYDLITGEPPPPKNQGIVNLYTQEYFQLLADRLNEGGIVTYWLPVSHLTPAEAKAVIRGFCGVFDDCSLWAALPFSWMLVGTKNLKHGAPYEHFIRQWNDPVTGPKMRSLGFQSPEQFGSFFIADGDRLALWLQDTPALVDNYPKRLSSKLLNGDVIDPEFMSLMDGERCKENFLRSRYIAALWPKELRAEVSRHFAAREDIFKILGGYEGMPWIERMHRCLHEPLLKPYLVWALNSDNDAQDIITAALRNRESIPEDEAAGDLAARAVMTGDYRTAERLYADLSRKYWRRDDTFFAVRMYLLFCGGDKDKVEEVRQEYINLVDKGKDVRKKKSAELVSWLEGHCR